MMIDISLEHFFSSFAVFLFIAFFIGLSQVPMKSFRQQESEEDPSSVSPS